MGTWSPGPGATSGNDTFTGDGTNETANGQLGDDTLHGNGGLDNLTGHGGSDVLNGGDGDDNLYGGTNSASNPTSGVVDGADTLSGGAGNDVLRGQDGDDILSGGDGSDNIRGDAGNDSIDGGDGEDWASYRFDDLGLTSGVTFSAAGFTFGGTFSDGRGGMDTLTSIERVIITGTTYADVLTGSAGRDQISTYGGADVINAGAGNDTIFDYNGSATLNGGDGNDRIVINSYDYQGINAFLGGADTIDGGAGADAVVLYWDSAPLGVTVTLTGTTLDARSGDNAIVATGTNIEVIEAYGSAFSDTMIGGAGDDSFGGGDGEDNLSGGGGRDWLSGGRGSDILNGGDGNDWYDANDYNLDGFAVRNYDFSAFDVSGGTIVIDDWANYEDTLTSIEGVYALGGNGNDTIIGSAGHDYFNGGYGTDTIDAGDGDDIIYAGVQFALSYPFQPGVGQVLVIDGNDTFIGGNGQDTLSFEGFTYALTIDASLGTATSIATGTDSFSGFELFIGGDGHDTFIGSNAGESFIGGEGNDNVDGGGGADTLDGGAGNDTIAGGAGNDTIIVRADQFVYGEVIDGGADTDEVVAYGDVDFGSAFVGAVETFRFAEDGVYSWIHFYRDQLVTGLPANLHFVGSAEADEIDVTMSSGQYLDLSGWTFSNWDPYLRQVADPTKDLVAVFGAGGNETIVGSTQSDSVFAGGGNDIMEGREGSDYLRGQAGDDTMDGGDGDDVLRGGAGVDTYIGGAGADRISFYEVTATQGVIVSLMTQTVTNDGYGNAETMSGIEDLGGGTVFADWFEGNNGDNLFVIDAGDTVIAHDGNDTFQIGGAPTSIDGGDGEDTITRFILSTLVSQPSGNPIEQVATNGVIVDLGAGQIIDDGFGNSGTLTSIEHVGGSALDDSLTGSSVSNTLTGYEGNDILNGGGGVDTAIMNLTGAEVSFSRNVAGQWIVTSAEGVDTLTSVEQLTFTDGSIALDNAQRTFFGNGTSDLLFRNVNHGTVVIWDVTGTTQNSSAVAGGAPAEWTIVGTGDLNGDGRDDMVWRHTSGGVAGWLMNGTTATSTAMIGGAPNEWQIAGIGDFNFDGKDDFVWRNTTTGAVAVWLLDGLTSTSQAIISGAPMSWDILAVADFDGDGRDDILLRNTDGTVARWTTDGVTQTSAAIVSGIPSEWSFQGAGDFDGDGRADIIWRNSSGGVAMWRMDGDTQLGAQMIGYAPAAWSVAQVGDFNGDGQDDLIWRHTDGTMSLWTMDGFNVLSQQILAYVPPEWELI